jgi:putative transposase
VGIAPNTYRAAKTRPPSARSISDAGWLEEIRRVQGDRQIGRGVYGARKVWNHLVKVKGHQVARCTVERLMRADGLQEARRGKAFRTTRPDGQAVRPPDLVQREFRASRPNELWVVDFTYVPTWAGMAFTAFVTDVYSRRIVGWRTGASMPTELPLDAVEMALRTRERAGEEVGGVVHHSDAGSQLSTRRSATRTGSPTPVPSRRSPRSVIRSTTRWPSR